MSTKIVTTAALGHTDRNEAAVSISGQVPSDSLTTLSNNVGVQGHKSEIDEAGITPGNPQGTEHILGSYTPVSPL